MNWDNQHLCLSGYLYGKFIEEVVGGRQAYYRPAHLAPNQWAYHLNELREGRSRPCYLLCVKLAGLAVVRVRLPSWVSVRVMPS